MDSFELLGDEELYQMAKNWSNGILVNMSKTCKRMYNVFHGQIEKRKLNYEKIKDFKDSILDRGIMWQKFIKRIKFLDNARQTKSTQKGTDKDLEVTVCIVTDLHPITYVSKYEIQIKQYANRKIITDIPWILDSVIGNLYQLRTFWDGQCRICIIKRDSSLITVLAENLINQGYEIDEFQCINNP